MLSAVLDKLLYLVFHCFSAARYSVSVPMLAVLPMLTVLAMLSVFPNARHRRYNHGVKISGLGIATKTQPPRKTSTKRATNALTVIEFPLDIFLQSIEW